VRLAPLLDEGLPPGVDLYGLAIGLDAGEHAVSNLLTANEAARARRFTRIADRARFAQTRAALRTLLADRLRCRPQEVPLASGQHGKPFVDSVGARVPLFNVSHSGAHALIAMADPDLVSCIGVDIERQRHDTELAPFLSLAFTDRERLEILAEQDVTDALYTRWVGKEAVLKAIGVGVPEHLQQVGVHPGACADRSRTRVLQVRSDVPAWSRFQAISLAAPRGYAAALAWRHREMK
jgi:4'-phosphopantetheinyl transferase